MVPAAVTFDLALRIPAWANGIVYVYEDGHSHPGDAGSPGSYLHIKREWKEWHSLDFVLPAVVTAHVYTGITQIHSFRRFCFTHGPVLLAVVGVWNSTLEVQRLPGVDPSKPEDWLVPDADGNHADSCSRQGDGGTSG